MTDKIQVQLSLDTALVFHQRKSSTKESEGLQKVLDELKVDLQPVHPNIEDPVLIPYFEIEVPESASTEQIIERLRSIQEVDAVYTKPQDEAP